MIKINEELYINIKTIYIIDSKTHLLYYFYKILSIYV